jgi:hypothetical protein
MKLCAILDWWVARRSKCSKVDQGDPDDLTTNENDLHV